MPNTTPNLQASGNIYPSRFVTQSGDYTGAQSTANQVALGISGDATNVPSVDGLITSTYHAVSGQPIELHGEGDICLLELGDTVTAGQRLKPDGDGKGVPIATTGTTIQQIGARAIEGGSSGEKVRVQVLISSERPALT